MAGSGLTETWLPGSFWRRDVFGKVECGGVRSKNLLRRDCRESLLKKSTSDREALAVRFTRRDTT